MTDGPRGPTTEAPHHVTVESQTWRNVAPYPPVTLHRATCRCGARGLWHYYPENVERACPAPPFKRVLPAGDRPSDREWIT